MNPAGSNSPRRPWLIVAAVGLLATACGGGTETTATALSPLPGDGAEVGAAPATPGDSDDGTAPATPGNNNATPGNNAGVAIAGTVDPDAAQAAADANIDGLQLSDDVRLIEVINVADGSVATLADAVWGDRPVLLWFWAPH